MLWLLWYGRAPQVPKALSSPPSRFAPTTSTQFRTVRIFILDVLDKWQKGDDIERRFGPPSVDDVVELCQTFIAKAPVLFTGGARCYEVISKKAGYIHDYVYHGSGQYAKDATIAGCKMRVHTNGIDGC